MRATDILKSDIGAQAAWRNYAVNEEAINKIEIKEDETHYPDQKPGKMNNRKKTFDAACREMLFDICRNHGLHLDYEPEYGGRA